MLYDPEEFWEQVRTTIREEIANAQADHGLVQAAIGKAGLTVKPAYTTAEVRQLFQISAKILQAWIGHGLLRPTRIGRQVYILYADLVPLFNASYFPSTQ